MRRRTLLLAVLLAAGASFLVRSANHLRVARDPSRPGAGWIATDPDSLYHMRRLDRALAGGPVAPRDPLLAFPEHAAAGGAPIPWPPYYTLVLRTVLAPFAPADPALRRAFVEERVASAAAVFATLTAALVALAAGLLAGPRAAVFAGVYYAFQFGALRYGIVGNGDHHAWVALLFAALLFSVGRALGRDALASTAGSFRRGLASGVLAGLLIGSWVAGLLFVMIVQLALGWRIVALGRAPARGLAPFGLAFHLGAALVLAPAVLASPWLPAAPFSIVNLSAAHLLELVLGALVFVPLTVLRRPRALALYPWLVVLVLALGALALAPTTLGEAVRAGFAWAGGTNRFMGYITESQPLLGGDAGSARALFKFLGYGVLGLPVAWFCASRVAFRREPGRDGGGDGGGDDASGDGRLLPWVIAAPVLLALALVQRRFGEALGVPMAVLLGWGLVRARRAFPARLRRLSGAGSFALAALIPVLLNPGVARTTALRLPAGGRTVLTPELARQRGHRALAEWLRERHPEQAASPEWSVLAQWDLGHTIEWAGGCATVATNFGLYLGVDSYLDPWRFFLATDAESAEALLVRRRARYVLLTSTFTRNLDTMLRVIGDERGAASDWRAGMGARLLFQDGAWDYGKTAGDGIPDFLRLVHVAPEVDRGLPGWESPPPFGWIFERVPGARLELAAEPGSEVRVTLAVRYPGVARVLSWRRAVRAGPDGVARLRVPYATDSANGDGCSLGPLVYSRAGSTGEVAIPGVAVESGQVVIVP